VTDYAINAVYNEDGEVIDSSEWEDFAEID
jgi:hypothetical protein